MTRPATIHDVSRLADVSRMTVTRVLGNPDLVKPETRARVLQAVAELNYVPDRAAGSLATRRTGFVGLVLPTLTNTNFSLVAHGLTEVLRAANYQLLIAYDDYSLAEEERQLRNLLARRPEAIVMTGMAHSRATAALLARSDVPVVEVAEIGRQPIQHAVGFSNHAVGRLAARHLIGQGFTRIGSISSRQAGDVDDARGEDRINGFEEELRLHGLPTTYVLRNGTAPVSYGHGAAGIALLLERFPDLQAVFCVSDLAAAGAVLECQRLGIAVPGRVSIMGFGDFEIGRMLNPPLTTIGVDFIDLGRRTGRLVLDLVAGDAAEAATVVDIAMTLIERGSIATVAAVRAAASQAGERR